jgi:glycosyltransferase involved in cell wall biosynthesis
MCLNEHIFCERSSGGIELPQYNNPRGNGRRRHAESNTQEELDCAIFMPDFSMGGVEKVLINLANGLASSGYKIEIVVCSSNGEYLQQALSFVPVTDLQTNRVLGAILPLARYLRERRPRFLITGKNYASIVALWARALSGIRTKIIITIHALVSRGEPGQKSFADKLIPALMKCLYRQADSIVAVSHAAAIDTARVCSLPIDRISIIYNPVITESFWGSQDSTVEINEINGQSGPIVLAAGRLSPVKGFDGLIRAFCDVPQDYNARLVILGDGPERKNLQALVDSLGLTDRVSLPGYVSSTVAYMKKSRLFVLSSLWECLPTVVIEALAVGLSVVAYDCPGGLREIIGDGEDVVLVAPGDTMALGKAIAEKLHSTGILQVSRDLSEFTSTKSVQKYIELMHGLS